MQRPTSPGTDDHHHGVNRIARERRISIPAQHDRYDQRHLDHSDGDGKNQRPVRLAGPVRYDLGVIYGRKDRTAEHRNQQRREGESDRRRIECLPSSDHGRRAIE